MCNFEIDKPPSLKLGNISILNTWVCIGNTIYELFDILYVIQF